MLLGTEREVELARKFSKELAEKRTSSADELLNALPRAFEVNWD